jgi:primosomal protein N' (replication factor Y)
LPLAIPQTYTYRVPRDWQQDIAIGKRLIVQFGKGSKQYAALVARMHHQAPERYQAKYILSVVDESPIVTEKQFTFWQWLAEYYMATMGEVMIAALPAGLRLASETRLLLHPEYQKVLPDLEDDEYLVVEALELRNVLSLAEISDILQIKHVQPRIKNLINKKAIMAEEEIRQRYRPKLVDYVKLHPRLQQEALLKQAFDQLERAPRQLEVLMNYMQLSRHFSSDQQAVKKSALQKVSKASSGILRELEKKQIVEVYQVEAGRLQGEEASESRKELSAAQQKAFDEINEIHRKGQVVLLHGVTSSGKTEIYIELIKNALDEGKQVLYLLPEIALTTQIVQRLQAIFGEKVGVYHSRFNENERVEVWNKVLAFDAREESPFQIILGARSAVFLPFQKLGLLIIDEEHETSFKQYDPAPRYHGRDAAIYLAHMQQAKVVLGSATPSVESYQHAREGKYGLVELKQRFGNIQLPEILVADIKEASRKKKMKSHFSEELLKMMEDTLQADKQIILFQNRRGFSPILLCETCGHVPACKNCDVSLTYHKLKQELICHYCGFRYKLSGKCEACGDQNLRMKGFGTEKIEEELAIFLPKARIARMDLDTTRAKKAYYQILGSFQEKEIDILVGTQMVTKGLDFEDVGLVGILNADQMLQFPDFRAYERSYQLMSQVAGRAGRKGERGKVLIQTYNPHHQVIRQVIDHDYEGMFKNELIDRRNFRYPPFYRLIQLTLKHKDKDKAATAANHLGEKLRKQFGSRLLGPEVPPIGRIRNYFLQQLLLKLEKKDSLTKSKTILAEIIAEITADDRFKSIRLSVDVDVI